MDVPALTAFHSISFFGFYLPPLLLWASVALIPYVLARWAIGRAGLYRFVWHRPLFNLALYVLILGGMIFIGGRGWL
ncbi:DUF1656 domain-containing protein [Starkeya sp. ORNL1]|uniref:DUF1656 domain-containing protein n=1 Tax=Starkeya sp. ORNL1 TaxID=2709380 RepID=UPI0014641C66|nr:DUF1656 domain-containing protein [Starkeya sp. ORNL1]QJP17350.1 DUF1656 domain-containing protein [Starkeya sp. ORNL1]